VDRTCGMHGRGEKSVQSFGGKEREHSEDQDVGGRMGSEWILGRLAWGGGCGLDSTGSGQGLVVGCCECGDELMGFLHHGVS
jgi:hypothetical protein